MLSAKARPIVIGLVNNMPDAALRTTERQFCELLSAAARDYTVCVRFFSLPGLSRACEAQSYLGEHYEEMDELWDACLDGLIVTGTEPRAPFLPEEPYWPILAKLVDWAEEHTISTVWSCLAAHAAVLHSDGICRRRLGEKLFGLFECTKASDHAILTGAPSRWRIPHSRYNDLPEEALIGKGYRILSRSCAAGADMFVRQTKSLFVFLQGHPEYDAAALLREYRRDIRRFLAGERDTYPKIPRDYFDDDTVVALDGLRTQALRHRDPALLGDFPTARFEAKLTCGWSRLAVRLYVNWLTYLVDQKYSARLVEVSNASAARAIGAGG